jgi:hypothetical protein
MAVRKVKGGGAETAPILERKWLAPVLLVAIAFLAYANSFGLGLATDAKAIVTNDARIRDLTSENLNLIFNRDYWWPTPVDVLYRPVTILSYLFNYALLGDHDNPAGYHALNFLLHAANGLLVFALCRRLFDRKLPAFFAAALWTVHPVGTESITNVSGRADLLAALGILGGLVLYIRARAWTGWSIVGLFALTLFASLSKENGAVLPGLMLLWDSLNPKEFRRTWRSKAGFYGAALAAWIVVYWMRQRVLTARPWPLLAYLGNPLLMADFWAARFTAIKVLGLQLWLMIWPLQLSFDRSYHQIPISTAGDSWAWFALVVIVFILAVVLVRYRRDPALYFAAGFAAICFLPTSNLIILIGSVVAERFLYLPSIGFAIAVTALAFRWKRPRAAEVTLAAVVVLFAGRTFVRNFDWNSNLSLETADVSAAPDSYRTHDLLSRDLYLQDPQGNLDHAIQEAEASIRILDGLPAARTSDGTLRNIGLFYIAKGDRLGGPDSAQGRMWYERAREGLVRARSAISAVEKEFDAEQLAHGRPLVQRNGGPEVYQTLGFIYSRLGQRREAIETLRYGRGLKPDWMDFYPALTGAYLATGDVSMAAATMLESSFLDGGKRDTLYGVREIFTKIPGGDCATTQAGGMLVLNYGCPAVRQQSCVALNDLAGAYTEARQPAVAQQQRARAVQEFGCPANP